jgi:hypothetical protein
MEWNHECVSKSERKCWALESEFLKAWAILHKFSKQGCCKHVFLSHRLIQNKQRNNSEATKMMARKVHVGIKKWEFHLVTPPKCQKLPSSIPKTAHVKFRTTSSSLSTTLWWYYRGHNQVVVMRRCLYLMDTLMLMRVKVLRNKQIIK